MLVNLAMVKYDGKRETKIKVFDAGQKELKEFEDMFRGYKKVMELSTMKFYGITEDGVDNALVGKITISAQF